MPSQLIDAKTQIKNLPYLDSRAYDWDEVNGTGASGDLSSPGAGKVITFQEAPQGIAVGCYVYITGGTGTAEIALITAETCSLSGYGAGTITVTTANAHSGAWQVGTATAGIQEALSVLPVTGGTVLVAAGTHTTFATIRVRGHAIVLKGEGRNTSTIYSAYHGGPIVFFDGPNSPSGYGDCNEICDITIRGDGTAGSNYALHLDNQTYCAFNRITVTYVPGGIKVTGETNSFGSRFHQINIVGVSQDGIHVDALPNGGQWDDVFIGGDQATTSNGIHLLRCEGFRLSNAYTIYCGNGFLADPSSANVYWVEIVNAYFDASESSGFAVNPTSTGRVIGTKLTHVTAASTENATVPGTGCGFVFGATGTIAGVCITDAVSLVNEGAGYFIGGGEDYSLINCIAAQNSCVSLNSYDGLDILAASNVNVIGGMFGAVWDQPNSQRIGIAISAFATDINISGAVVTPNLTGSITNGSSTANIVACRGYNPVGPSAITVTASPFTYTSGSSPETVYINGGTVSVVARGAVTVASSSPAVVSLQANQSLVVTYSVAPTMVKDVH